MKAKILVIDDDQSIRYNFEQILSKEGHEVLTAEDYDSAMKAISLVNFDLIFADVMLGEHTGIEILGKVREKELNCPVIVITAYPDLENAADSVRLGAFDYLSKPVPKEKLLHATHLALQQKALLDEKEKITQEKERYRRHLEAIFRSVNDGIVTVNQKMKVIEANESAHSICGMDSKASIGKSISDIPTQCNRLCHEVLSETLKHKKTVKEYRIECGHQHRSGQVVVLSSAPLMDQNNKFIGAVLVIRDITRLTNLEKELMERNQFQNIIGTSKKMQEIYKLLDNLADTETTVLIKGESGTGKELVANALHYSGVRSFKPLVKVNCSALSENLLESELFGHVKGAFTGAIKDKQGRFQIAHGGTILLDEIGDISPGIQLKLLRVIQEKEIERVGDSKPIKVDVRIIASTNRDLKKKVELGEFREDLFYRLKVIDVNLPPLRDRREDIPILIEHFCRVLNERFKKNIDNVSDEVLRIFMEYSWPGNIRELEHAIEHAFILCHGRTIMVDHLPPELKKATEIKIPLSEKESSDERLALLKALEMTGWNKAKAARLVGISRRTIYRKIEAHKLEEPTI